MVKSPIFYMLLCLIIFFGQRAGAQVTDTLINVGNTCLQFKIIKGTGIAILFENGGGMELSQWDSIGYKVYQQTRATVISYNRQGLAKSGLDSLHYNIKVEINNLTSALKQLGYSKTPFISVCHSLGSFYSNYYIATHKNTAKGLIMIDPRIPSVGDRRFAKKVFDQINADKKQKPGGIYYLLFKQMERNSLIVSKAKIPANLPILDLMAAHGPFDDEQENLRFKNDQRSYLSRFPKAKLLFVKNTSHNIAADQPKLVVTQIVNFYKSCH